MRQIYSLRNVQESWGQFSAEGNDNMGLNVLAMVEAFNPTSGHARSIVCLHSGLKYAFIFTKPNYASTADIASMECPRELKLLQLCQQFPLSEEEIEPAPRPSPLDNSAPPIFFPPIRVNFPGKCCRIESNTAPKASAAYTTCSILCGRTMSLQIFPAWTVPPQITNGFSVAL